jgi:hypothetical protein
VGEGQKNRTDALSPLFQQQWNFSPNGSTSQIKDYEVDLMKFGCFNSTLIQILRGEQPLPLSQAGVA